MVFPDPVGPQSEIVSDEASRKPGKVEQLVAYLDGELDDDQTASMEKRLRKDPQLRQLAEDLDRTWGMLDALEPVVAGEEFSQKTMETIVTSSSAAQGATSTSASGHWLSLFTNSQALAWFGIGVLGALCGLSVAMFRGPSEETVQLLGEIEMLERYPQYSILPNAQALKQLDLPPPQNGEDNTTSSQESP